MAKIRGKFAPLFTELGEDPRWLMDCNDQQKFLYFLILLTVYECNNSAPDDPRYYKVRYNLRHRLGRVEADLRHIKERFPKLVCQNKKLSLLNYRGYENRVAQSESLEVEIEENKKENKKEEVMGSFEEFWRKYPKKVAKANALKAWAKLNPSQELLKNLLLAIDQSGGSESWLKDGGQFIPHPATWLNQRRWEDEPPIAPTKKKTYSPVLRGSATE